MVSTRRERRLAASQERDAQRQEEEVKQPPRPETPRRRARRLQKIAEEPRQEEQTQTSNTDAAPVATPITENPASASAPVEEKKEEGQTESSAAEADGKKDKEVATLKARNEGMPKSNRPWKKFGIKKRASTITRSKPLTKTWEEKLEERARKRIIKEKETALREEKKAEREAERRRLEQRRKQKELNELRGSKVVEIKDTSKIKKMNKKQLKNIKKM